MAIFSAFAPIFCNGKSGDRRSHKHYYTATSLPGGITWYRFAFLITAISQFRKEFLPYGFTSQSAWRLKGRFEYFFREDRSGGLLWSVRTDEQETIDRVSRRSVPENKRTNKKWLILFFSELFTALFPLFYLEWSCRNVIIRCFRRCLTPYHKKSSITVGNCHRAFKCYRVVSNQNIR